MGIGGSAGAAAHRAPSPDEADADDHERLAEMLHGKPAHLPQHVHLSDHFVCMRVCACARVTSDVDTVCGITPCTASSSPRGVAADGESSTSPTGRRSSSKDESTAPPAGDVEHDLTEPETAPANEPETASAAQKKQPCEVADIARADHGFRRSANATPNMTRVRTSCARKRADEWQARNALLQRGAEASGAVQCWGAESRGLGVSSEASSCVSSRASSSTSLSLLSASPGASPETQHARPPALLDLLVRRAVGGSVSCPPSPILSAPLDRSAASGALPSACAEQERPRRPDVGAREGADEINSMTHNMKCD